MAIFVLFFGVSLLMSPQNKQIALFPWNRNGEVLDVETTFYKGGSVKRKLISFSRTGQYFLSQI